MARKSTPLFVNFTIYNIKLRVFIDIVKKLASKGKQTIDLAKEK